MPLRLSEQPFYSRKGQLRVAFIANKFAPANIYSNPRQRLGQVGAQVFDILDTH